MADKSRDLDGLASHGGRLSSVQADMAQESSVEEQRNVTMLQSIEEQRGVAVLRSRPRARERCHRLCEVVITGSVVVVVIGLFLIPTVYYALTSLQTQVS